MKNLCGFPYSKNMANFEAFGQVISSSINLLFLKSQSLHNQKLSFTDLIVLEVTTLEVVWMFYLLIQMIEDKLLILSIIFTIPMFITFKNFKSSDETVQNYYQFLMLFGSSQVGMFEKIRLYQYVHTNQLFVYFSLRICK